MRNKIKKLTIKPYLFIFPIMLFAIVFVYYPFFKNIAYSFSKVNFKGQIKEFVFLENYKYMFGQSTFQTALKNTLKLTLMFVPINFVSCIILALLSRRKRFLSPVFEVMFMIPMAISLSAAALSFEIILNPTIGIVNKLLGLKIGWFNDKHYALYGILIVSLWIGYAFNYLIIRSALRNIDKSVIEAAKIDGANSIIRFFKIDFILILPTIFYILCIETVMCMMVSGPIMILTEGGPCRSTTSLIYLMYTSGYRSSNYSLASCISIFTFLLVLGFLIVSFFINNRKENNA
jgi:sn-glycerol 3-phosphate transport system permease protein